MDFDSNHLDVVVAFKKSISDGVEAHLSANNQPSNARRVNEYGEIQATRIEQSQKRLTDEEIGLICSAYRSGKSTYQLAREFGCHRNTISNALKSKGIEVTKKSKLDVVDVATLYEQGYATQEIADKYNVGPQVILRCLKAEGIKIRGRWG